MGGDAKPMALEGKICLSIAGIAAVVVTILSVTDHTLLPYDHPMSWVWQEMPIEDFKNGKDIKAVFWDDETFGGSITSDDNVETGLYSVCNVSSGPDDRISLENSLDTRLLQDWAATTTIDKD